MTPKNFTWLFVSASIALLDAAGKWYALSTLPSEHDAALRSVVTLALHKNPGIAFDIPVPFWIIGPVTSAIIVALAWYARTQWPMATARSIAALAIVFGAGNNLIDRAVNGFTTDYIILFATSAINLSDVLIIAGAIALIRYTERNPNARTS